MFKEILYPEQINNIKILETFSQDFYLAGETAIALQLWHRKSIDFDMFSTETLNTTNIIRRLLKNGFEISQVLIDNKWEEFSCIIWGTKLTFLYYPFHVELSDTNVFQGMSVPNLIVLWAMKFYTLGRRWKWKDYVDIYFLLQIYSLKEISNITEEIFAWWYNEKLLREQLCYFEDIDFSEEVEYMWADIPQEKIQSFLIKQSQT